MIKLAFTLVFCALILAAPLSRSASAQDAPTMAQNSFAMADKAGNIQLVLDTPDQSGSRFGEKCFPGTNTCMRISFQRGPIGCPDDPDDPTCHGNPEVRGSIEKLPLAIRIYPSGDTEFSAPIQFDFELEVEAEVSDAIEFWDMVTTVKGSRPASADGVIFGIVSSHTEYENTANSRTKIVSRRLHVFKLGGPEQMETMEATKLFVVPFGKSMEATKLFAVPFSSKMVCDAYATSAQGDSVGRLPDNTCADVQQGSVAMVVLDEDNIADHPAFHLFMGGNDASAPIGPEIEKIEKITDLIGHYHIADDQCYFVRIISFDPETKSYVLDKDLPACKYTDDVNAD